VLLSGQGNFGPSGHHHPRSSTLPHEYIVQSASAISKCILEVIFSAILPRSPQLCQNDSFSIFFSTEETENLGWVGTTVLLLLAKNYLSKNEVWDAVLSWKSQFFVNKIRDEVIAHLHTIAVKCHSSMRNWLFGLPGRIVCEQSLMSKKMMSMLLTFLFTCLAFFSFCPESSMPFKHPCATHTFFPEHLSNHCQGLRPTFPRDSHKIWPTLAIGSIAKSHQARHTTLNKRMYKISTAAQLREIMYTDSQDLLSTIIYRCIALLQLHREQHQSHIYQLTYINIMVMSP
jgi:hypothetical protein